MIRRSLTTVIACHNRRAVTLRCLEALDAAARRISDFDIETILVDDGCTDGTASAVAELFPATRIVTADGTLWWAGAMALGLRSGSAESDFQLWLNDDVVLRPDALARLVETHDRWLRDHGRPLIVAGSVLSTEDGSVTFGGGRRSGFHPLRSVRLPVSDLPRDCELVNGNVLLVPRAAASRLGGIDPVFAGVQSMADTDYGLRALALDIDVAVAPGWSGHCDRDTRPPPWRDPDLSLVARLRAVTGPRGRPWRAWFVFARRHGGPLWPVWWAAPLIKGVVAALRPDPTPDRRVLLVEGVVPDYRFGLMRALAQSAVPRFIVYHGDGQAGLTAAASTAALPIAAHRGRNIFWPRLCGGRFAWTAGSFAALGGRFDAACVGLHTHDLGVWAVCLARRLLGRPKVMISGHFALSQPGRWPLGPVRRRLRRILARSADAVLPYTEEGMRDCLAIGIPADRIFVCGNSVDVEQARASLAALPPTAVEDARRRYGLPDGAVFLFIGRLYATKRVDAAIGAMRLLAGHGVKASLLVVGSGVEDGRLRTLAADLPTVRFAAAEFDPAALAALFALATAVVVPGSVGLVAAHAAAHGVPVIACRAGAPHGPEFAYLEDGESCLLTDAVDPAEIAAAMERLAGDAALLARLRRGAWRTGDALGVERAADAYAAAARRILGLAGVSS
ncbi:glycosyltransferase [Azospirillum palustre]|nr:glycosyltransferase [Azospirillum palustre]